MSESKALEALFPGPRRLILCAMFAEPERWWSLPDLAGRAGVQPASLRQHVVHLRKGGLVRERQDHGHRWFQPDPCCTVYSEMHSIVTKLTSEAASGETILIVEDQPATAQITRILLESWGYRVFEARRGDEALGVFSQHGSEIQLVLTDVIMPGMTGPQLVDELLRRNPSLRIVYMSGYVHDELIGRNRAFLPKPFNPVSLSRMIRKELDRPLVQSKQINQA